MSMELKPCPFCGRDEELRVDYTRVSDEHQWFHVECVECGFSGPSAFVEGAAIDRWNLRTNSQDALIAELVEGLKDVANPLRVLERQANKDGAKLNSSAHSIANNLAFVQSIARATLAKVHPHVG